MKGLIVGLDIGSSAVRIAAGQCVTSSDQSLTFQLIGAAETPSEGILKGNIHSFEDVVSSISACLEQAERLIGLPIEDLYVSVSGTQILIQDAKGVAGVTRADQTVQRQDVSRVIDAARTTAQAANYEIIHVLPKAFSVDNQKDIKDPVGMQGIRLEADVKVVQGLSNHLKNLTKAVFRTKVDIAELVYAPLAAAEAVLSKREKELGVCVLNIGASSMGMAVYEEGELLHANTFLSGANLITSDLVYTLRTSLDVAERLKRAKGHVVPGTFSKEDTVNLKDFGADVDETFQLGFIAEVMEARVEELFEIIEGELKKIERSGMLPAGIILTGGGAKLPGMTEVARRVFHLPSAVGSCEVDAAVPEIVQDPCFSTAVGLVKWGYVAEREAAEDSAPRSMKQVGNLFSKATNPIKKIFKSFMP